MKQSKKQFKTGELFVMARAATIHSVFTNEVFWFSKRATGTIVCEWYKRPWEFTPSLLVLLEGSLFVIHDRECLMTLDEYETSLNEKKKKALELK